MKNIVNVVYLLLGTNMGQRSKNLATARQEISEKMGDLHHQSSVFETEPWGITNQPAFYNQVLVVHTFLQPEQLLTLIHQIEHEMGRERKERYGARIIDIDILFFNQEVYHSHRLSIPHPRISERNFVLAPLSEIAPDLIHPVLQQPLHELLKQSKDPLQAVKIQESTEEHFQ